MQSIYELVSTEFASVNELILGELHSHVDLVEDISRYLVDSGGKRVRPLATLLVAAALDDSNNSRQIKLATAIEFLHTATLLHDDVVDMSTLRRGKPTANANWGNAPSVLVGDFVYSRAFQLMVAIGSLPVMEVISDTTVKIAEGEVKQLAEVGNLALDERSYFQVIQHKTAQLFAGACQSAAILADCDQKTAGRLRDYGMHLGLAFQLIDDFLDYAGDAAQLGKNVGDDLAEGKLTLPLIYALQQSALNNPQQHSDLKAIVQARDLERIAQVIDIVKETGGMSYTLDQATKHMQQCQQAVVSLPDSPYRQAMIELAEFVVQRAS